MENMENEIVFIKLDDIIPNRFQPREVFDEVALNELADSIRQHGVIQPIVVRQVGNKYEIIAGERRYKASALAGLTKIPAIIKNLDDKESSIVAYIENAQRRNVSAIEEARTSERILKTNNMTQEQLARELGISQSALANKLRLLSLPMEVQEALMKNEISERHARSLLSVKEPEKQIELLNKIKTNRMTVRELEGEIKAMYGNNNMDNNMFVNNNPNGQFMPNNNPMNNSFMNSDFSNMNDGFDNNFNNNFNTSNPTFNQPISTFENNMVSNNNYSDNSTFNSNVTGMAPIVDNSVNETVDNNDFLNFANNFDPSKYEKNYVEDNQVDNNVMNNNVTTPLPNSGSFLDFINDYDTNYPNAANDIMASMENNNVNNTNNEVVNNNSNDFMNFVNNYDMPVSNDMNSDNNETAGGTSDFNSFINTYDDSNLASSLVQEENTTYNTTQPINNPIINEVVPPITSNFNNNEVKYVEEDVRYNNFVKPEEITSIDDIIGELQTSVNKIKNSKFKVDTDEINFDDVYQITIKIDKRDIL